MAWRSCPAASPAVATDMLLRGVGVLSAAIAAGFAIYMHAPGDAAPELNGAEHMRVFAQLKGVPPGGAREARAPAAAVPPADVDPVVTGSIAEPPPAIEGGSLVANVPGFRLLGSEDGVAHIRSRDGEWKVRLGAVIPGAGRVLAIERRGARRVVLTTLGAIGE